MSHHHHPTAPSGDSRHRLSFAGNLCCALLAACMTALIAEAIDALAAQEQPTAIAQVFRVPAHRLGMT